MAFRSNGAIEAHDETGLGRRAKLQARNATTSGRERYPPCVAFYPKLLQEHGAGKRLM
jgi:hypothetical protein